MEINRRSFLKSLAALTGVSAVPALGISILGVPEPRWFVEEEDYEQILGVGGQWIVGSTKIRHAVSVANPAGVVEREEVIRYCKQAIRQWYYERHILKRVA